MADGLVTMSEEEQDKRVKEMSALDVLLGAKPVRQQETLIIRQRDGLPGDLKIDVGSLSDRDFKSISEQAEKPLSRRDRRAGTNVQRETDGNLFLRLVVAAGTIDPNFNDDNVLAKHGVFTGEELVQRLLLPGEIARVAEIVMDLSGFNDNSVDFIKN